MTVTRVVGEGASRRLSTDPEVVILSGIQGPPGVSRGFNWRGDWSAVVTYAPDDAVLGSDGKPYVALLASINLPPQSNPSYWDAVIALTASGVPFDPTGLVELAGQTNVQDALEDVDATIVADKAALTAHLGDVEAAHNASAIYYEPGSLVSENVQDAIEEIAAGSSAALDAHLDDTVDAHDAVAISFSPVGTIAATDAQTAIAEVATDAAAALAAEILDHETNTVPQHDNFQGRTGFALSSAGAYDNTVSYDPNTRQLTITPTGSTFNVWVKGTKFVKTGAQVSGAHAAIAAGYFFYYDDTGTLQVSTSAWDLREHAPVCYAYWVSASQYIYYNERHTIYRDPGLHAYLHATMGTQVDSGFGLSGYTLNVDSNAAVTWATALGVIRDEDLRHEIAAIADSNNEYATAYRSGASGDWVIATAQASPYLHGATYPQYNQFTGGAWQLTELSSAQFMNFFIFALPAVETGKRIFCVPSQQVHATLALAQGEGVASMDMGSTLTQEIAAVWKLTFRAHTSYTNTTAVGKAQLQAVERIVLSRSAALTGVSPTIHNSLSGRADADAHPATAITNTPTAPISATTVQAAIDELAAESVRANRFGATVPGPVAGTQFVVGRAPRNGVVSKVWAIVVGGTSVTVNAQRGANDLRSSDLAVTAGSGWTDFSTLQNTTVSTGDAFYVEVVAVSGGVSYVGFQIEVDPN